MPRGLILQPTYRVRGGRPVVQLYGRCDDGGPAFLIEDDRFRPYFFVRTSDAGLVREADVLCEETELCSLLGDPVSRVTAAVPGDVPPLRERLVAQGVACFEADVRFPYRYLIDRGLRGSLEFEARPQRRGELFVYRNPEMRAARCRPELRVLSLDLETTPDASAVYSVAFAGCDAEEVHMVGAASIARKGLIAYADERSLLEAALARLRELDPDVIVGWNVVDFDLQVLARRCESLRLPCQIGRAEGAIRFQQDPGFTRQGRADVPGRSVLDGIALVRDALRLEDYRLQTVAQHVLGRGKLIDEEASDPAAEIERMWREEPEALAAYNLEDARLVIDILAHEGLLDLTLERSLLSGMQLDRVGASIASFDLLYLPALRRAGFVAPSVDRERKAAPVRGGAVLDSEPGLFRNVAVFDFKSLYPSLIRTFQLDPLAHALAERERGANAIEAPNAARFARQGAILPGLIEDFAARREAAKARGDRHADQAIKLMMNSMFGVLGSASCRFFDPAVANAITGFGQQILSWTREGFEAEGVRTLYGDTDSVFVQLAAEGTDEGAGGEAEELRARVESRIAQRIEREHGTPSRLVLELEKVYERFFMPRVRGGKGGSKKRYAGLQDGNLEVVGLESVRRDWPVLARRLQEGLLERLFRDEDPEPFARELVQRMQAGELDRELVYSKRLRKGSLERYTASAPPHVQAARKLGGSARGAIRYVITREGPEPLAPGRPFPERLDRAHYLEKVIRPVADAILCEIDSSLDDALGQPKQLSLL